MPTGHSTRKAPASVRDSGKGRMNAAGVNFLTIASLKTQAGEQALAAVVDAELQSRSQRQTKTGKPYLVITFADSTGSFALNAWSDAPLFDAASGLPDGSVVRLDAQWTQNSYGLDARDIAWERLTGEDLEAFYAGDPATAEKQRRDWDTIVGLSATIVDPRLQGLVERFLADFGPRFRRAAAARRNHHARRGGLVEHVAQMMRSADAICSAYPSLNRDLLLTGTLFHDCGKLWENQYGERGFAQNHSLHGEMLGHISLGIELVNKLWRDVADSPAARDWLTLEPATEKVRLHLLHLIASHHGEYQFGSPVLPRTPEAITLHYIDNLDAKLEMMAAAYDRANVLAEGIYEKQFPLPANLVEPLPAFEAPPVSPPAIPVREGLF